MSRFLLRLLQQQDALKLAEFEYNNRHWFEDFIEKRNDTFYQENGVEKHIEHCLKGLQSNTMYPMVIVDSEGNICGRANLHQIDIQRKEASVGYRVAQQQAGRGAASLAMASLLQIAFEEYSLVRIKAFVSTENPASRRVLDKFAFQQIKHHSAMVKVKEQWLDCVEYHLSSEQYHSWADKKD
ncbi:GNAT family N-acetyltransferase [Pleionea sp. CnH1-48]|uniref:GNAT family N-acetyltransferase n=1 Tax=Pleionea sp. CnH1-48 TaxID=2954494 RepID=UPI002097C485|nr:GNAT family N-acetyltransferase [Pleionea sp. CnH1-48]MCO7226055.1 GNAT family N-acetyltransferase [Pleionea sp. CnH1-48]